MKLNFWEAVATLVGAIIGAGIFGIPYVVAKAGFITGSLVIFLVGGIVLILYLYLGEVVLRTEGKHQLTGYAEKYLGKWGKRVMLFSMVVGLYGALIAYFMGEGKALSTIFSGYFGGSMIVYMALFFVVVTLLLYFGIEALEKSELATMIMVLAIVSLIIAFTSPYIETQNLKGFNITKFFIPFGVVLFAYLGMVAVPEASEILGKNKQELKKALLISLLIPIVVYFLFALVVVGAIGIERFEILGPNERIATIALGQVISQKLFVFANVFTVLAMFTSFMAIGYALKEMFMYDYKIPEKTAWFLTCFFPFLLALLITIFDIAGFIGVLNVSGIIAGGIDAIIILLMFHRAKKMGSRKPEYSLKESIPFSVLIGLLFIAGAVFLII